MNYIKISKRQIETLKQLPSNLNDSVTNQNISGIILLSKSGEFKQIILDFSESSLQEFFTNSKDTKVYLKKHIRNKDPRNRRAITFEIINRLNTIKNNSLTDSINKPNIDDWIKCIIHSIFRKVFNHLIISSSDSIFVISMKKNYYYFLVQLKKRNKWKLKEMYHYLRNKYIELYSSQSKYSFEIPEIIRTEFNITECKNTDINFYYHSFNEDIALISI